MNSKIIKLTAENVKKLSAVEITPQGNVVVIGGANGAGKSSVLDAIQFALGGEPDAKMPVRRGEEKAKIVVDLGEIVVRRSFTATGGGSLVVTNADGVKQMSPQTILDKLIGKLTFDPLAFAREKPLHQADILRQLIGLDFTKLDADREKIFNERTTVNREAKALENRLAAMPKHEGIPDAEVPAAQIVAKQQEAARHNALNADERRMAQEARKKVQNAQAQSEQTAGEILRTENEIARLQGVLKALATRRDQEQTLVRAEEATAQALEAKASKLKDIDLAPFQTQATEAEAQNRKVRENRQRAEVVAQYKAKQVAADQLTSKLAVLDSDKRKATTEAKYPVPGLMFDTAGGVTLNGIPFDQCSAAEQLKVSVAIGLALNPKLRVLLIRDGSLLDDGSMKTLLDMAKTADAQVWLERVGTDSQTSVVIEDGHIAEKGQV